MKINRVTITGIDDGTAVRDLQFIEQVYPYVEWGVLFSKARSGTSRYPLTDTINSFTQNLTNLSAHLCGSYAGAVVEKNDFSFINSWADTFKRFQLNYNFGNQLYGVKAVVDWARGNPAISIIFQANYSNALAIKAIHTLKVPENVHFLYDSSGGRGTLIKDIKPPFNTYTGYSGGFTPENLPKYCEQIINSRPPDKVWLDMETGVRTGDELSIEKVHGALSACRGFVNHEEGNSK